MKWEVDDEHVGSDHFPVLISWFNYVTFHKVSLRSKYNLNKIDWNKYKKEIKKILNELDAEMSVEAYDELNEHIIKKLKEAGAKKSNSGCRLTPPPTVWWTEECTKLIEDRREAEHHFKNNPSIESFDEYIMLRKKAKRDLRKIKRRSFRAFCQTLSPERNLQEIWNTIKGFKSRFNSSQQNKSNSSKDPEVKKEVAKLEKYPFQDKLVLEKYYCHNEELSKNITNKEVEVAIQKTKKNQHPVQMG